jgi:hypothetical protein
MLHKRTCKKVPSHAVWNETHPNDPIVEGDGYLIHHKDLNHNNDSPDNLQKVTRAEHNKIHHKGKFVVHSDTTKDKIRETVKQAWNNGEYENRDFVSWNKGLTKDLDGRVAKQAEALKGKPGWSKGLTKEDNPNLACSEEKKNKLRASNKEQIPWSKNKTKEEFPQLAHTDETKIKLAEKVKQNWKNGVYKNRKRKQKKGEESDD